MTLKIENLRQINSKRMGDGWPSLILDDVTPDDLLAYVRHAVESGTIEGEVQDAWQAGNGYWRLDTPHDDPGTYLILGPLSDGEEES